MTVLPVPLNRMLADHELRRDRLLGSAAADRDVNLGPLGVVANLAPLHR
jgi:hypothetical protein